MDRIARVGRNAVCVRAGEGGLSATGGVGAVLALVNNFGALLAHLHYYHHHHWRSHRSHNRCRHLCRRNRRVVVAAGGGFDERIQKSDPKPKSRLIRFERDPRPNFGSAIFRRLRRLKMWSSRNQMLNDNDGDDVAFLSGSGDDIL